MADRYWVGGTGTWNSSATAVWSSSSGGAGGASVPTASDNVIFDSATTYTVTVSGTVNCLSLTVSAGTVTFSGASTPIMIVSGNFTISSTTTWNMGGELRFVGSGTITITTNGINIGSSINWNNVGGTFTLGSALLSSGYCSLVAGTLDTSTSNYSLTLSYYLAIDNTSASAKTLKLRGSTVNLVNARINSDWAAINFTLDAGTSNVTFTGSDQIGWDGLTWYNVTIAAGDGTSLTSSTRSTTFNNLTISSSSSAFYWVVSGNATINGTLTATSSNGYQRKIIVSNTPGTSRTLTVAASSLTNVDFQDISISGAGSPLTGTRLGDGGNNSGITFAAARSVFLVSAGSPGFNSSSWATSSGGATSADNFPSAHDTINIDNSSAATSGTISTTVAYILGEITFANRTNAVNFSVANNARINKNITLASSVTVSTGTIILCPPVGSTQTIANTSTVAGWSAPTTKNSNGTTIITSNFTMTGAFTHTRGTLDLNNFNLTNSVSFASSNSNTRTLAFGTGKIVLSGTGTVWNTGTVTGLTVTGTPVVDVTNSTATATTVTAGATTESNSVSYNFTAGTYSLSLTGNQRNVSFTGFSGTLANSARTIYGNLTVSSGMTLTAGTSAQTFAATSGSKTITSNGKTFDFPVTFNGAGGSWILQDNLTVGSTRTVTHTNGTVDLNGKTFNVGASYTTATGTKNLTFNAGTLTCANSGSTSFNNAQPTNFTTTAGTGTGKISMTSASAKTFVGGDSTYNCTLSNDGAGALTITGSNTFTTLANGVQPTTFTFTSGTTTTVTNWTISGTAGNLVTIGSTAASKHTLLDASGTVSADYLSISYSAAFGGAYWLAGLNSTDGGNNAGWIFSNSVPTSNFFLLFN